METNNKDHISVTSKCSLLPRIKPRSTVASRARKAQLRPAGENITNSKTTANTPRLPSSRASHCEDVPKLFLGNKERSFNFEVNKVKKNEKECLPRSPKTDTTFNINDSSGGGDEEVVYLNKKTEYLTLKEDLEKRQTAILVVYSYLKELHGKMVVNGREVEHMEPTLNLLDVSGWATPQLSLITTHTAGAGEDFPAPVGDGLEMPKRISEVPSQLIGLCHEILAKRHNIIEHLQDRGSNDMGDKIQEWNAESDGLQSLLENISRQTQKNATAVSNEVSALLHQAMEINSKYNQLNEQQSLLKTQLGAAEMQNKTPCNRDTLNSVPRIPQATNDLSKKGESDIRLGDAVGKKTEMDVKNLHVRIRNLERELKDSEKKFSKQAISFKELDTEIKNRESQHETRLKNLRDTMRTTEQNLNDGVKQKEFLQARVDEQTKQLEESKINADNIFINLRSRISELERDLETQTIEKANVTREFIEQSKVLEEKSQFLLDTVRTNSLKKQISDGELAKEYDRMRKKMVNTEAELRKVNEENAAYTNKFTQMFELVEELKNELNTKEITAKNLEQTLSSLTHELQASQEMNQHFCSLQKNKDDSKDLPAQEKQLNEAKTLIETKVEEIKKLRAEITCRQQDMKSLNEQMNLVTARNNEYQKRSRFYEKRIGDLEDELENAKKRYPSNWSNDVLSQLSNEFPQLKRVPPSYVNDECKLEEPYHPCPLHPADIFTSGSEFISQQRNFNNHSYNWNHSPNEKHSNPSGSVDRSQVLTILRPCRKVRLTPEMRLQPISSLMSAFQRQSFIATSEETKTKDIFLMSKSNHFTNKTCSHGYHF